LWCCAVKKRPPIVGSKRRLVLLARVKEHLGYKKLAVVKCDICGEVVLLAVYDKRNNKVECEVGIGCRHVEKWFEELLEKVCKEAGGKPISQIQP